jgi:putative ABC transport system permease protein
MSAAVSILTGALFGISPAVRSAKLGSDALKESTRGGTAGVSRSRLRSFLVAAQVAMALVLLSGAGLLLRSFAKLAAVDLHMDPTGVLTFGIRMPQGQFGRPVSTYNGNPLWEVNSIPAATLERIFERIQEVPGVLSAAGNLTPPLLAPPNVNFSIEGQPLIDRGALTAQYNPITPGFFSTMRIALLRGRDFSARDTAASPWVTIVNETMAKRFWPNEDPLGRRIKLDLAPDEQPREIIGVVHDTPSSRLQTAQQPALYVHFPQAPAHVVGGFANTRMQLAFVVRTAADPVTLLPTLRAAIREVDPNRPLVEPRTVEQSISEEVQLPRYDSMLIGTFAIVATCSPPWASMDW